MTYYLRLVAVIAFGIVAFFSPTYLFAQSPEGLQIKPAIVEDTVILGGVTEYSVSVTNVADGERTFYLSTQDIKGLDDAGLPVFAEPGEATGYEVSSWISLPSAAVTLPAGETRKINFSVHVPNRANPGSHFGAIFLTNRPVAAGTTGSAVGYSVAAIVSMKISGESREEAVLRELSTEKMIYSTGEVDLVSRIENLGNVLIRPHGVIEITDMFGRQVGGIEVNPTGAPVFPGSVRKYPTEWIADGFAFGRYQAIAAFSYGDTDSKTISATTSFWVLPMKPIAIALGVLLALIVGMYAIIRVYIRRKLRDMGISNDSRDAAYYARKYQRSGGRMIVVTLLTFLVCVFFLAVLFLAFA